MNEFDEDFGFERLLSRFTSRWHWFLISVVICFLIAFFVARVQTPMYVIHAKVLINDPRRGAGEASALEGIGIASSAGSAVENEAEVLRTKDLVQDVVEARKLNIVYYYKSNLRNRELYEAPFVVDLVEPADTMRLTSFDIRFLPGGKIELAGDDIDITTGYSKPIIIADVGTIQILKAGRSPELNTEYAFDVSSVEKTVERLSGQMEVLVPNKTASVIDITFNYPVPKKGVDILSDILQTYVQTNLNDRNKIADSTYSFIQNRLKYLGGELGSLEGNIQSFRQKNNITAMSEQSSQLLSNTSQYLNDLAKIETQISVLTSLQDYMHQNAKNNRVVPSSLVVTDPIFSSLVEKYNTLLLDRDKRLMSVTETNPDIVGLDQQIANLRSDMLANLGSSKNSLGITRDNLRRRINAVEGQVQNVPEKERNYLDLARQQKIKEDLFIFLMQRGEETAISKTYNTPNSKNIDTPKSETSPVSPKKIVYYIIGVFIGLIIPAAWIYLRFLLNTRVDSKEDVTQRTKVPIVAEISHNDENDNLIVNNKSRSAIAEQFRALRTNLAFYLKKPAGNLILLTSSMSGEGKSFVSVNLGTVLAMSGKRVLLMELDLRKPGLSTKFELPNNLGFTNYVIDENLAAKDIIRPLTGNENMFIIASGILPPNPAEILMNPRTAALFLELQGQFDYIIMDAPPIGVVTDAQLLGDFADLCLYVIRQNYSLKSQLGIVNDMSKNQKMKQIGLIINDIKLQKGSGYGYGYGYNYGSYGQTSQDKNIWKKFSASIKRRIKK